MVMMLSLSSALFWWPAAILFLSLTLLININRRKKGPPLPPGPLGLPIIGNLLSLHSELHCYYSTLAQTYGPILSLKLGSKLGIIISSPALAKQVLKDHDVTFARRDPPKAAQALFYGGKDIVWTDHGPQWRLLRKMAVTGMLGAPTLEALYDLRHREIRKTIRFLSGWAGRPVKIGEVVFMTMLNVITETLWGGRVQTGEEREKLGKEFREVVQEEMRLLGLPNVSDFFPGLGWLDLQGVEKKMKACVKKFDAIFEREIQNRLKMGEKEIGGKDFLQVLMQMKSDMEEGVSGFGNNKVEFSMDHLKALLMDMIIGGTDTTLNTLEFAMAEILNKAEVLRNIQQELEKVVGKDKIVEEHHISKLPYLKAVMKETLRLYPVVPLLVPHCSSESCIIGGYTIPKGARVLINVWAIHRDPSLWVNPLEFEPSRFLDSQIDLNGGDFKYLPFGSGRRICAGIAMAERMVLFSLASLLHSFDWNLPQGENLDLQEKFGIVLSKNIPLTVVPELRLHDPALYK